MNVQLGPQAEARLHDFMGGARPQVALILGSGLGTLAQRIHVYRSLPFSDIAGLEVCSVPGHRGCVTLGEWGGKTVLAFEGRLHHYEGHAWRTVALPVQIAAFLGARGLLLTNAAGGIHEALTPGTLMAIDDHLDWTSVAGWRSRAAEQKRSSPYAARLLEALDSAADHLGVPLHRGLYAAVTGPCYETPAEIRALHACGADAVGMSTAREAEAACAAGLECAAVSCITNRAAGLASGRINHEEVLSTAAARSEQLGSLIEKFLQLV